MKRGKRICNQLKAIHVEILREIGGGCGQEAVRVVKMMPKWEPADQ